MVPSLCHNVVMKTSHINEEIAMTLVYKSNYHHLIHIPVVPDYFIQFYRTEDHELSNAWGMGLGQQFSRFSLLLVLSRPSYLTFWYLSSPPVKQKHQYSQPHTALWGSIFSCIMLVRSKWFCFIGVSPGTAWICCYHCTANKSARLFKVFFVINHLVFNWCSYNLLLLS